MLNYLLLDLSAIPGIVRRAPARRPVAPAGKQTRCPQSQSDGRGLERFSHCCVRAIKSSDKLFALATARSDLNDSRRFSRLCRETSRPNSKGTCNKQDHQVHEANERAMPLRPLRAQQLQGTARLNTQNCREPRLPSDPMTIFLAKSNVNHLEPSDKHVLFPQVLRMMT